MLPIYSNDEYDPHIETIDLDFVHRPHKHIFETHAQQNKIEFKMIQTDL